MSGATYLASIYGTEQDKVNCSFYYKIGACRHGDRCSRKHTKPPFSQTILVANVWQNPRHKNPDTNIGDSEVQQIFDDFYEDFFCELSKYGNVVEMHVCDNVGDHLIGNVYVRYDWEDEAQRAVDELNQRYYAGRPLFAELSPVTDFREACCRQNETGECNRGGFCNFMHLRHPTMSLVRELEAQQRVERRLNPRPDPREYKASTTTGMSDWKRELAAESGSDWRNAPGPDEEPRPDWRSEGDGGRGGGWRDGPSALDESYGSAGHGTAPAVHNGYAGGNYPTGADAAYAGSASEFGRERYDDSYRAGPPGRSASPPGARY